MADNKDLITAWKKEEEIAAIKGWDFSHLNGRMSDDESALPWDYKRTVLSYLTPEMKLLDIDTGGGEVLLSFGHPWENTTVTEGYYPNFEFCKEKLSPLGIRVENCKADDLPFEDETFDVILNRHGDLDAKEFYRVLKKGGLFITQQVGALNDRELVETVLQNARVPFPEQHLQIKSAEFKNAGFEILEENEGFFQMSFSDVGALVWFAKIIEWEFIDFSVDKCLSKLLEAQKIIDSGNLLEGTAHRFYFVAKKL